MTGMHDAIRYTGIFALRLSAVMAAAVLLCWALLEWFLQALPSDVSADTWGVLASVLWRLPLLAPTLLLAFAAGWHDPGSPWRLAARLALNAYIMAAVLFLTSGLSYTLDGLVLSPDPYVAVTSATLSVDVSAIGWIVLAIPACSVADAVLDYIHGTSQEAR